MRTRELPPLSEQDLEDLDTELLLCPGGRMRLRSAAELRAIGIDLLQTWCIKRARYTLITTELVEWLRAKIADRKALEIGAGQGDLGFHLGIPQTDLGLQAPAFNMSLMSLYGQQPTDPPPDVERIEAEAAVTKYQPQVVIGSWITQRFHGLPANWEFKTYGVEEIGILRGRVYIHVGNDRIHAGKRILKLKHKTLYRDWLVSRAFDQEKNCIRVWGV